MKEQGKKNWEWGKLTKETAENSGV